VKLDKRHMAASLVMLIGSIVYNVWVFTGSGRTPARNEVTSAVEPAPSADTHGNASGPLDPAQVHPLADVEIDRVPQWPRNPFQNLRQRPVEVVAEAPEPPPPPPPPPPDPVIASILYSSERRAAMIDGHIVRIGDVLPAGRIVDILPKAVVLESEEGRRTFEMKPASSGSPGK
jgi:hypothetical protein